MNWQDKHYKTIKITTMTIYLSRNEIKLIYVVSGMIAHKLQENGYLHEDIDKLHEKFSNLFEKIGTPKIKEPKIITAYEQRKTRNHHTEADNRKD